MLTADDRIVGVTCAYVSSTVSSQAWALQGELDNACHFLIEAFRKSVATEDRRGLAAIMGARKRMTRWDGDARLHQLDEQLRAQGVTA